MEIRLERPEDVVAISHVTTAAFDKPPRSGLAEAQIVEALRAAGVLAISLVATENDEVVGHVAYSPVTITAVEGDWYGLGPVSVRPDLQRRGIGRSLVGAGLERLRSLQAAGCVVLGSPRYYQRFGFETDPRLTYGGAPSPYFQRLVLRGPPISGDVAYHPAFRA